MRVIVVTRHPALVELLRERGLLALAGGEPAIKAEVTEEDIRGAHVIGVIPPILAQHAALVTAIPLDIPLALRGQELTLDQIRPLAGETFTYKVVPQRTFVNR